MFPSYMFTILKGTGPNILLSYQVTSWCIEQPCSHDSARNMRVVAQRHRRHVGTSHLWLLLLGCWPCAQSKCWFGSGHVSAMLMNTRIDNELFNGVSKGSYDLWTVSVPYQSLFAIEDDDSQVTFLVFSFLYILFPKKEIHLVSFCFPFRAAVVAFGFLASRRRGFCDSCLRCLCDFGLAGFVLSWQYAATIGGQHVKHVKG